MATDSPTPEFDPANWSVAITYRQQTSLDHGGANSTCRSAMRGEARPPGSSPAMVERNASS